MRGEFEVAQCFRKTAPNFHFKLTLFGSFYTCFGSFKQTNYSMKIATNSQS